MFVSKQLYIQYPDRIRSTHRLSRYIWLAYLKVAHSAVKNKCIDKENKLVMIVSAMHMIMLMI